jgi:rhodanese-related sulfurtransferase
MASVIEITLPELLSSIGTSQCPIIIDVRIDADFDEDPTLIPQAFRCKHGNVLDMVSYLQNKKVVVYCQKGLKLSQGATAKLRHAGIDAKFLTGGHLAWQAKQLPLIAIPETLGGMNLKSTSWVAPEQPDIDTLACCWFIRRFVNPEAEILFVESSQVFNVADKFDAVAIESFETNKSKKNEKHSLAGLTGSFEITMDAVSNLCALLAIDKNAKPELTSVAPGLAAAMTGIMTMFPDDIKRLDAAMLLFDAYFFWLKNHDQDLVELDSLNQDLK